MRINCREESLKVRSNYFKYYLSETLFTIVSIFTQGSVVNSLLVFIGLSEGEVSLYASLSSVIQLAVMGVFSLFADRVVRVVKHVGNVTILLSLFHLFMAGITLFVIDDTSLSVILVMIGAVFLNFVSGIRGILSLKVCYYVLDLHDFSRIMGVTGAIANIVAIVVSSLFSVISAVMPYRPVIVAALLLSSVLAVITGFIIRGFKILSTAPTSTSKTSLLGVLKHKATYILFIPNFIRGVASGIFALSALIMLSTVTDSTALSSFLHTVYVISATLACFGMALGVKKLPCPLITLIGTIIFLPAIILMTLFSEVGFICFYAVASVGIVLVDYSIPAYVVEIVPSDIMARYSSIRMFTHNAGIAVGSALVGVFLSVGASLSLLVIAGSLLLIVGIAYFIFYRVYGSPYFRD